MTAVFGWPEHALTRQTAACVALVSTHCVSRLEFAAKWLPVYLSGVLSGKIKENLLVSTLLSPVLRTAEALD